MSSLHKSDILQCPMKAKENFINKKNTHVRVISKKNCNNYKQTYIVCAVSYSVPKKLTSYTKLYVARKQYLVMGGT